MGHHILKSLHISRIFVRYGLQLKPLTQQQTLLILKYQLGQKYNKRKLCDANTNKPYFVESNLTQHDLYFFHGVGFHT